MLLHQAGLLNARVRPKEQEQVKEHKKQAGKAVGLTLCALVTERESTEGASLNRSLLTAPETRGRCPAEGGSTRLARAAAGGLQSPSTHGVGLLPWIFS